MIKITKKSVFSGKENVMELPLTEEEYHEGCLRHASGEFIQDAFPTLNPTQREFLLSGSTQEEWDKIFKS